MNINNEISNIIHSIDQSTLREMGGGLKQVLKNNSLITLNT